MLLLSYRFPPCEAFPTANARVHGFARHLGEHGWEPVVVTPSLPAGACGRSGCRHHELEAAFDRSSPIEIVRVPVRTSNAHRALRSGRIPRRLGAALRVAAGGATSWPRDARRVGVEVGRRFVPDVVLASGGPWSTVRAGDAVSRELGRPLVVDARDPVSRSFLPGAGADRLERLRRRLLVVPAMRRADALVHATDGFALEDEALLGRRGVAVRSGFEPADWDGLPGPPDTGPLTLLLTGALYQGLRDPDPLLAGLSRVPDLAPGAIELRYLGHDGDGLLARAEAHGVRAHVHDDGFVEPPEYRARARASDALVLLTSTAGHRDWPGGKFYEYLGAGRPILAVPGGDEYVADVLRRSGAGVVGHDADEIADVLHGWLIARRDGALPYGGDATEIATHQMTRRARALADVLDRTKATA